jgi:hypothetical protein
MAPREATKTITVEKLFTPAQANQTLPLVRSIVDDILEKAKELRAMTERSSDPGSEEELEVLQQEILEHMEELEALGCSYRDWQFDVGLVDFPARIDGKDVLLCWKSDEPRITHYHTPEGGFAGRRPIPARLLEDREN